MNHPDIKQINSLLFQGIESKDLNSLLHCLAPKSEHYPKGTFVIHQGDSSDMLGLVQNGSVHITHEDYWGNQTIVSQCRSGELFGETYALLPGHPFDVNVVAASDCDILFFQIRKLMTVCTSACAFHNLLIQNLLYIITGKNYQLSRKLDYVTQRSTKEKLLAFLSDESKKANSSTFTIPFNRQQLADYLAVDRSAMSNELCKLRDEGVLSFQKNEFHLN